MAKDNTKELEEMFARDATEQAAAEGPVVGAIDRKQRAA